MGKRKYDGDNKEASKKSKVESEEENSHNDVKKQPPKNIDGNQKIAAPSNVFDIKHFRKELAFKTGQTMALNQFLQVCLNPDNQVDYVFEYLKAGGNSLEILRQISAENKKNLTLTTPAFHIFHLIILKVQSSLPHMIAITEESCRFFLNTFMSTVEIMISENSGPRHRKIILKLLTSIVTLNSDLGVEVLNQAPLTPKHLQYIVEKTNYKEKDNVRTAFVQFMTSFLVEGHLPLIKALLEKQGLLALVIPGLIQDEAEAVLMFLNILKRNVIDNPLISKSLKLKTFSHQVIHNIFKIFSWRGPPELSHEERKLMSPEIVNILTDIIQTLFTNHKLGLYFIDNSLGTADANKNQNLYKSILTLKRPWENEDECETILQIVYKCPDLHRAVINVIEQSFEPQHSPIFEKAAGFVLKLLNKLNPDEIINRMATLTTQQASNFIRFVSLPVPILKHIQSHLGKDLSVSLYCIKVLVKMLHMLRRYMHILALDDTPTRIADLKSRMEYFIPKHLPPPATIVSLINDVVNSKESSKTPKISKDYKLTKISNTDSLINLLDLLLLYNEVHSPFFETLEGTINLKNILDYSASLDTGNISLLKFKVVSLWLVLDDSAISVKNPMFKELFLIMLEVYTMDDDDTWIEAKDTLHKFFINTTIFEADEDEIHLMLYTLRNSTVEPISLIADIVEYVLEHTKVLTDYVRNQIVHFEISDETSEASLDKLFNDLMENRTTENSYFLESKVPSPFIVGCIQFIQNNKEAKKCLKKFLCLYVANLLHSNYSPELTEVLIGDSKLDVRSYVASWTGQPVALLETLTDKDKVMINISKSIINNEEMPLTDIFTSIEETSDQISFVVEDKSYTIDVSKNIDSSELLIWAKYLIYCTVRLTNMDQFLEDQQNKIFNYLECIIALGKKHHLVNTCRVIILTLFKNPQILKIYQPLDSSKDKSKVLATKFLLKIVTQHRDIVKYLMKKYNLLKSYQQKNYTEIIKSFIKIKKKKHFDSDHTSQVLETIGLAEEEDKLVFEHIFNGDINNCVKDDKEPSLILELLRVLIDKYSRSPDLEIAQDTLRKVLKLYTDLLTKSDTTANLTKLESSLINYFEYKTHQVKKINEDYFKQFFYANAMRKTTSNLAAVLLKHNVKFCHVFKEEIKRNEILSQRELTLPLGNVIIHHTKFIEANKDLLETIYNEYKSNIWKVLEKPHKAGQIYISCWEFVRKMLLECMSVQDCAKLFSKCNKFENVEISHLHLFQAAFLKLCVLEKGPKKEHILNYLTAMLNSVTLALKENKESNVIIEIVTNIYSVIQISKSLDVLNVVDKAEFTKITESAIWNNFCKATLKDSLKVRTANQINTVGPQLLYLLTTLVELLYPVDHQDIVTLFEMVTSHSEFLNVMLSHHSSDIKSRLIEFIYTLVSINKSIMKSQQIPVYLSAYHATRSPCDRLILSILQFYESSGLPVNEYKPYVFGDSAANFYAVRKNRGSSLWSHPSPNQVLNLFEKDVLNRTVKKFPVTDRLRHQYKLEPNIHVTADNIPLDGSVKTILNKMSKDHVFHHDNVKNNEAAVNNLIVNRKYIDLLVALNDVDFLNLSHERGDESIYDPVFLMSLLSHLLAPGSAASCFKLLRSGLFSVPVMALSSTCPSMRAAAYHVLHRFCMLLETETRHKNDKLFLTDFINTLVHSLSTAITSVQNEEIVVSGLKNPRLPAVDALYLAKALTVSTAPIDPLYKPVNNFFIAKQVVDFTVVPDFLSLFHDSDVDANERRLWILDVIKNGVKTMTDVTVIFKTMCLKMIMDYYSCVLCDRKTKENILGVVNSLVSIPRAFEILVEGYGLMSWLHAVVRNFGKDDKVLVRAMFSIVENSLYSMLVNSFAKHVASKNNPNKTSKALDVFGELKANKDVEMEISIVLCELLHHLDNLEVNDMIRYVNSFRLLTKKSVRFLTKKQMLSFVNNCGRYVENADTVNVLVKALVNADGAMLNSKHVKKDAVLVTEISNVVQSFLN